jgi:hypothetical protein
MEAKGSLGIVKLQLLVEQWSSKENHKFNSMAKKMKMNLERSLKIK